MWFIIRHLAVAITGVCLVMAWWFPAPVVLRYEPVDWQARFEARNARRSAYPGAAFADKSQTLAGFMAEETSGHVAESSHPFWAGLVGNAAGNGGAGYVEPHAEPFSSLKGASGFVVTRHGEDARYIEYRRIPAEDFRFFAIPADVKHPVRRHWPFLLAITATMVLALALPGRASGIVEASSAGRGFRWSASLGAVFAGMVAWPFVYGTVGDGAGYASILTGGLFFTGALVGMWLFGRQSVMLRRMVAGDHLARFSFTPDEWRRFAEWNFSQEGREKKSLWLFIFVISLIVGLGFMIVMRDEGSIWVFVVLMALMAILWLLAVGLPRLTYRRDLRGSGLVYVGRNGVYLNGTMHSWNAPGARFESAELRQKPILHIHLVYSYLMLAGRFLYFIRNSVPVRIPVPTGQEELARTLTKEMRT